MVEPALLNRPFALQRQFLDRLSDGLGVPLDARWVRSHRLSFWYPELRKNYQTAQGRALCQLASLTSILDCFEAHDILTVVLKGITLSCFLYGTPFLRETQDIDLLVPRSAVVQAATLLQTLGYVCLSGDFFKDESRLAYCQKNYKDLFFFHASSGVIVELHWEVLPSFFPYQLPASLFFEQKQSFFVPELKKTIWMPRRELLIIYLSLHGIVHGFYRAQWLLDLFTLLNQSWNHALLKQWVHQFGLAFPLVHVFNLLEMNKLTSDLGLNSNWQLSGLRRATFLLLKSQKYQWMDLDLIRYRFMFLGFFKFVRLLISELALIRPADLSRFPRVSVRAVWVLCKLEQVFKRIFRLFFRVKPQ